MPRDYERPTKAHRDKITVRQHVLPRATLRRFCNESGYLELFDKEVGKYRHASPDDHLFVAMRRWDQRAEGGYMRGIEDDFQRLATDIESGSITTLDEKSREITYRFFSLWGLRSEFKRRPDERIEVKGIVGPSRIISPEEMDELESLGVISMREDGSISERHFVGLDIQRNIDRLFEENGHINWGISKSEDGHFLIPDQPFAMLVPVSPTIVLLGANPDGIVEMEGLKNFNRQVIENSERFYFARDLDAAPT